MKLSALNLRQRDGVTCGPTVAVVAGALLDRADGADLSELPMGGFAFERCSFIDTSFKGAVLDRSQWNPFRLHEVLDQRHRLGEGVRSATSSARASSGVSAP